MKALVLIFALISFSSFGKTCNDLHQLISEQSSTVTSKPQILPSLNKIYAEVLNHRVSSYALTDKNRRALLEIVSLFRKATGEDLIGEGVKTCATKYSAVAFDAYSVLVLSAKGAASHAEAFEMISKKVQKIYGDNPKRAKLRTCMLAGGKGSKCQMFNKKMQKFCP